MNVPFVVVVLVLSSYSIFSTAMCCFCNDCIGDTSR